MLQEEAVKVLNDADIIPGLVPHKLRITKLAQSSAKIILEKLHGVIERMYVDNENNLHVYYKKSGGYDTINFIIDEDGHTDVSLHFAEKGYGRELQDETYENIDPADAQMYFNRYLKGWEGRAKVSKSK